jgi:phosphatidylserine/phosphatidylglycerophosphate/cardiolipin synthase-like enzyme
MRTDAIYEWLAEQLREREHISRADIENTLDDNAEDALFFLEFLVTRGVVRSERRADAVVYTLVDAPALKEIVDAYLTGESDSESDAGRTSTDTLPTARQAVVSVPLDMQPALDDLRADHPDIEVSTLREAVITVLQAAKHEVCLAVPFFEQSGLNALLDHVMDLAARGVDLRVLTRDVQQGDGYDHTNKCRALAKLTDLYGANQQVGANLSIRDFGSCIRGHPNDPSRHYRGIHQKMVIADETVAYVGSGEIRENSFLTNGEAGVLTVSADEVAFWLDFFDLFWQEATDVEKTVARAQSH